MWEAWSGPPGRVQRDHQRERPAAVALVLSVGPPAATRPRPVRLDDLALRQASAKEVAYTAVAHVEESGPLFESAAIGCW